MKNLGVNMAKTFKKMKNDPCWKGYKMVGMKKKGAKEVPNCVPEETYYPLNAQVTKVKESKDLPWHEDPKNPSRKKGTYKDEYGNEVKNIAKHLAKKAMNAAIKGSKAAKSTNEEVIMERGADKKGYYRKTEDGAGLTRKGAKAMGVKTAVTTPPSKLDPNGKAAKRRKSFCARMGGMKGPMKDEKGRPTRKAMSLRRWNCNEETQLDEVLGKENEWGRPELRKKFATMTPGQECMANDKIPEMDIHKGFAPEVYKEEALNEISALGAKKRAEFAAKLRSRLADPKVRAKAKQDVANTKQAANPGAPHEHLVMQLRKATSIGSKVKFRDGGEHHVAPNHVEKFNDRYHSLKSSIEKEGLVKRAHKSHADFMRAISEEHVNCGTPDCCGDCDTAVQKIAPMTDGPNYPVPELSQFEQNEIELEVANEIEEATWEELLSTYDNDEWDLNCDEEDEDESEELEEGLTPQGRLKKKFAAIRTKNKRNLAKNLQLKRIATPDRIKKRATRTARNMVYKRLLRGRDRASLSPAEKTRYEAMAKRMAPMVARLSVRMLQKERVRDRQRVANKAKKK
jgi:hypothetical protein